MVSVFTSHASSISIQVNQIILCAVLVIAEKIVVTEQKWVNNYAPEFCFLPDCVSLSYRYKNVFGKRVEQVTNFQATYRFKEQVYTVLEFMFKKRMCSICTVLT